MNLQILVKSPLLGELLSAKRYLLPLCFKFALISDELAIIRTEGSTSADKKGITPSSADVIIALTVTCETFVTH